MARYISTVTDASVPVSGARRLALAAFVVFCIGAAAVLRFHDIGRPAFWIDEFFHVFAAQSYLKDGSLTVPLHGEYTRAFAITRITAWSFQHFGVSEISARVPFATVNLLFLLVSFLFIRRIYGLAPALGTLFVLSFAPFMITLSRECRMYTVFQLLYFSCMMSFQLGVETDRKRPGWEGKLGVDARWLAASAVLFAVSTRIHELTWNGGLVIAAYLACMFVWESITRGLRAAVFSKYGISVGFMALTTVAMLIFARGDLRDLVDSARTVPLWMVVPDGKNYYRHVLEYSYPFLFFLYPLGALKLVKDHGRRGFFGALSFSLLFVLHSLVFGRKEDRYIFYLFPFFVLASAGLYADFIVVAMRRTRAALGNVGRGVQAAACGVVLVASSPFLYKWFPQGLHSGQISKNNDWAHQYAEVRQRIGTDTVIETDPLGFLYYMGRLPDFYLLGEVWDPTAHAGRLIRNAAHLKAALDRPGTAIVRCRSGELGNPAYFTGDMVELLEARTHVLYSPLDKRTRYFEELPSK